MLTSVTESGSVVNDQNSGCKNHRCKRSEADPAATSMSPTYRELLEPSLSPAPQQGPPLSAKTPSPSATPPSLHLSASPVIALGNPIATRTSPLTTSITTTTSTTATPIKSAANVRAHFNLIGGAQIKMATDTLTDIGSTDSSSSATTMIVADFYDDNNSGSSSSNTSRTTTKTTQRIDTDNALISEQQPLRRATQEHKSKLTTTVEAATTTTTVDTHTICRNKLHESQLPAASSDKSEPHENKCAAKACQTLSYSREVELNRSQEPRALELDLNTIDVSKQKGEGLSERQKRLSFAERNQKLKADFLADFSEQSQQQSANTEGIIKAEPSNADLKDRVTRRKAPQHLKLHIPAAAAPNRAQQPQAAAAVLEAVLEPPKLTLVARRKLELKRRFEQQTQERRSAEHATAITTSISAHFPSVQELKQRFDQRRPSKHKMIVQPQKLSDTASPESSAGNYLALKATAALEQRQSPLSDEGCNLGQSPYSSDEDNVSIRTTSTTVERKRKDKVARSASSDSALGLDVEEPEQPPPVKHDKQRRMTLTVTDLPLRPALLPLAEPTALPDSPTTDAPITVLSQATIPSKVLLEERVVEIPEDPRIVTGSLSSSRRESAQSCLSDYPLGECPGVRFVRTPSVVVSDYSDDVMCGITLEEIEYFRAQRLRRRRSSLDTTSGTEKDGMDGGTHSDVSASSSCSNLYYCGSTISALDGAECYVNGMRMPLAGERKASACSTCSASGGEEDDAVYSIPEQPEEADGHLGKDLAELLAAQQLNTKRPKKVGICEKCRSAPLNEAD